MKHIVIHPGSLLAGVALGFFGLLATGAQTTAPRNATPILTSSLVRVSWVFDPNDAVLIHEENGPYTVPAGKMLAITGFGSPSSYTTNLYVDGIHEGYSYKNGEDCAVFPSAVKVVAGSIVTVQGGTHGRIYGYLIDA